MKNIILALTTSLGCSSTVLEPPQPAVWQADVVAEDAPALCRDLHRDMCLPGCITLDFLQCPERGATIGRCKDRCEHSQAVCEVEYDWHCVMLLTRCDDLPKCRVPCGGGC